jgi:putative flippase GtrA
MSKSTRKESIAEKIRFLIVGGFNTFIGFGAFAIIQFVSNGALHEVIVLGIAHIVASTVAFFLHRRVVFRVSGQMFIDYIRFQSVYVIPLTINALVLPLLVRVYDVNVYIAQLQITVVAVLISYLGHKYFSFRRLPASKP